MQHCCNQVWIKSGGQILWNAYTYLRNIQDLLSDGKTPYERRFGEPFKGPIIPFGSLVEYYPISAKGQSRIHQFGKKVFPGLFLGYASYAGGLWKGDIMIADIRRWTNQTSWKRSRPENTHLDTETPNSRRRSRRFSWRIRRVSSSTTSRFTSGCR